MREIAYYDGKIARPSELSVPFDDRSHFFGDGVYDATIAGNGIVYLMDEHIDRFYSSARALNIKIPMSKRELGELLTEMTSMVDFKIPFVYWQVSRGVAPRFHAYDDDMQGKILAYVRPMEEVPFRIPDPVKCITCPDNRFELCNIKTLNLIPSVMAYQKAQKQGCFEAILHRHGIVTECAHSNVSILKDGELISHPNDRFILRGIGKTHLIQACYREGVSVIERTFSVDEMMDADEIIITSSSDFAQPVAEIDGIKVGGRDMATLKRIGLSNLNEFLRTIGEREIEY